MARVLEEAVGDGGEEEADGASGDEVVPLQLIGCEESLRSA